jgi:heme-degrading monooxygenase HmoA
MQLSEMDEQVTYMQQLQEEAGPVVLVNVFKVAPEDADQLVEVWADDAAFMKRQPGFISTQLHRGTAGSSTFVNVAEWESAAALGEAFRSPEDPGGDVMRDREHLV